MENCVSFCASIHPYAYPDQGSPDYPVWWFTSRTHRTQKSYYAHSHGFLQWKAKIKMNEQTRYIGCGPEETRFQLLGVLSQWSPTETFLLTARMDQHLWSPGNSPRLGIQSFIGAYLKACSAEVTDLSYSIPSPREVKPLSGPGPHAYKKRALTLSYIVNMNYLVTSLLFVRQSLRDAQTLLSGRIF